MAVRHARKHGCTRIKSPPLSSFFFKISRPIDLLPQSAMNPSPNLIFSGSPPCIIIMGKISFSPKIFSNCHSNPYSRKHGCTRIKSPPLSSFFFKISRPIDLLPQSAMNPSPNLIFSGSPPQPNLQIPFSADAAAAAATIQSAYRSHRTRSLYRRIAAVNAEADRVQSLIQRQDTVDAIRSDDREKLRMNETLMRLLLDLDAVPGSDPTVREGRRKVSRRIVGLQEILDGIAEDYGDQGLLFSWDTAMEELEERVCKERGGEEMDRFCAEYLGFRCFQRFIRE